MSRSLETWTAELPGQLRTAVGTVDDVVREVAEDAVEIAKSTVPVRTGALRASIEWHSVPDGAEVRTDDPAAAALLERTGIDYLGDAVAEAGSTLPDRVLERLTAAVT